jgi:hypothetical protein
MTAGDRPWIGPIRRTGNRPAICDQEQPERTQQSDQQRTDLAESVGLAGQAVDLDVDLTIGVRVVVAFTERIVMVCIRVVAVLVSHRLLAGTEVPVRVRAAQPHHQHDEAEQNDKYGSGGAQTNQHESDSSKPTAVIFLNGVIEPSTLYPRIAEN